MSYFGNLKATCDSLRAHYGSLVLDKTLDTAEAAKVLSVALRKAEKAWRKHYGYDNKYNGRGQRYEA